MLDLVVGFDDQSADAVTHHRGPCLLEDRLDCRRLVIEPDQVKTVRNPIHCPLKISLRHAPRQTIPERRAQIFLGELGDVLGWRVLEAAESEAPPMLLSEINGERIDELALARAWNPGDDGELARPDRHELVERLPAR